jgi:hypothetical protein
LISRGTPIRMAAVLLCSYLRSLGFLTGWGLA